MPVSLGRVHDARNAASPSMFSWISVGEAGKVIATIPQVDGFELAAKIEQSPAQKQNSVTLSIWNRRKFMRSTWIENGEGCSRGAGGNMGGAPTIEMKPWSIASSRLSSH